MPTEPSANNVEDTNDSRDEIQDTIHVNVSNSSFPEVDMHESGDTALPLVLPPDGKDRRATFTFSVEEDQDERPVREAEGISAYQGDNRPASLEPEADQDATLVRLFRSPAKVDPLVAPVESFEVVDCARLPRPTEAEAEKIIIPADEQDETSEACAGDAAVQDAVKALDMEEVISSEQEGLPTREAEGERYAEEAKVDTHAVQVVRVSYPSLFDDELHEGSIDPPNHPEENGDYGVSETTFAFLDLQQEEGDSGTDSDTREELPEEENFTEASLQLDLQQDQKTEQQRIQTGSLAAPEAQQELTANNATIAEDATSENVAGATHQETADTERHATAGTPTTETQEIAVDDIAAGLTLGPSVPSSREPTPRKLRSPSPPAAAEPGPEDTTMTIALDDDTALLKDFLSRAAANRANKAASMARRESLQNRRDSDVVRHALASPRKVLEDKDPNSPSKYDNDTTLDLSQTLTLNAAEQHAPLSLSQDQADTEGVEDTKVPRSSRRSSRTRKSRLPAPASAAQQVGPPKIAVGRNGSDHIVLKKTDAQELSLLTRANTRKNKQGAMAVGVRLLKLANDAASRSADDLTIEADPAMVNGKKYVRWDEQLAYYQEGTDTMANMLAEAESLASPDELSLPAPVSTPSVKSKSKSSKDKNSTPNIRRVRGLGTANGTPGKGLLATVSLLPDAVQEEKDAAQAQSQSHSQHQRLPKPRSSKLKKMPVASTSTPDPAPSAPMDKLPVLDVVPVGIEPTKAVTKERKSRLATPRKVKLPQPGSAVVADGKENQRRGSIAAGTPKKGIPMPAVVVPSSKGVETGLPRRRGRKL